MSKLKIVENYLTYLEKTCNSNVKDDVLYNSDVYF